MTRKSHPGEPPLLPVIRPVVEADDLLWERLRTSLATGQLTNDGPLVRALEDQAANWLGCDAMRAVASGSAGLLVGAHALGVQGTVVLPSFTYIATLNAVQHAGWTPLFCDVDPEHWTLCPRALKTLMKTHRIDGVVAVNVFGVPPDLPAIRSLIGDRPLLYDNAHGFGTEAQGRRYGVEADVEVFSLHATKNLPSLEGGLVRCQTATLRESVSALRNHGKTADPLNSRLGFNAKMNEWSAALALSSLAVVDATLERRRTYLFRLREALATAGFRVQAVPDGVTPSGQDFIVQCPGNRHLAQQHFLEHGIETRPYFGLNLHHLKRFTSHPVLPVTEALNASVLAFPLHSRMAEQDLARIEVAAAAFRP